jgi:flavin-dependent dehydrogenase
VSRYDVVVVGGRVAGSVLALRLADSGARVAMVDRDELGSDTLSTHTIFPNTLARLDELGLLDRLLDRHELPLLEYRLRVLGRETVGRFTPVRGFDRCAAPRRVAFDRVLAEAALEAGVEARFGERVEGLLATIDGRIGGVSLASGGTIEADWTIGADGRASTVAGKLGLRKSRPMAGDMAMLLAYWRGLPPTGVLSLDVNESRSLSRFPGEDGTELLVVSGKPELTRGGPEARERAYLDNLGAFPTTLDPAALEGAERITEVRSAPETMLRGFFRQASGPGWALVGDAGHFKHPATAQGISDAIEQAVRLADELGGAGAAPNGFGGWRDQRASGHYEFSFQFGTFPRPEIAGPIFDGISSEPATAQHLRDAMSRQVDPDRVFNQENLARWFGA